MDPNEKTTFNIDGALCLLAPKGCVGFVIWRTNIYLEDKYSIVKEPIVLWIIMSWNCNSLKSIQIDSGLLHLHSNKNTQFKVHPLFEPQSKTNGHTGHRVLWSSFLRQACPVQITKNKKKEEVSNWFRVTRTERPITCVDVINTSPFLCFKFIPVTTHAFRKRRLWLS